MEGTLPDGKAPLALSSIIAEIKGSLESRVKWCYLAMPHRKVS